MERPVKLELTPNELTIIEKALEKYHPDSLLNKNGTAEMIDIRDLELKVQKAQRHRSE